MLGSEYLECTKNKCRVQMLVNKDAYNLTEIKCPFCGEILEKVAEYYFPSGYNKIEIKRKDNDSL